MAFDTELKNLFAQRISSGLKRASIRDCAKWACEYRVMGPPFPGKWTFDHHPWLRDMHNSPSRVNIGQKSSQVGFTEALLNTTFFCIDVLGKDVLYVLPAQTPDATVFSASRFDPALELSPHLAKMFSDVKNVTHKRSGTRNLYVRGSHSRGGLKSIPAFAILMDEVDEMEQDNIPLALQRTSGQDDYLNWLVSTPTVEDEGINKYFKKSTQNRYFFRCPSCSKFITFEFPNSIVITSDDPESPEIDKSHYICTECTATINHQDKRSIYRNGSEWVQSYKNYEAAGWHISRLYATVIAGEPIEIAKSYLRSLTDPAREQEFFNSTLGQPHAVEGARVTDSDIQQCMEISPYQKMTSSPPGIVTMGIDQGTYCHYQIDHWTIGKGSDLSDASIPRLLTEGKVREFEELDAIFRQYGVLFAVIDAQPERRKATEFANRHYGRVRLCFYPEGINAKQIHISDAGNEPSVSVDRTTWLDTSLSRFRNRRTLIPTNISTEYKDHIKAMVRSYERDRWGNLIGRYRHGSKADHFAHARNYSEIALHLAVQIGRSRNIDNIL